VTESLSDLAASFRRSLLAEGRAERTVKLYLQAPRFFAAFLGGDPTVEDLTKAQLQDWFAHLHANFEPGTVMVRWQGMNRFCKWLIDEDEMDANPMKAITRPRPKDKPVPLMTDDDLKALIKACTGKDFKDRRDEAIIRTLLDCGIRVSELCGITVEGLDLDAGDVEVTGKGGKTRVAYFGARTARALDRYKRMRARHRWAHLDALFLGERGALTADGVRTRMEVRAEKAGLADRANPHRFRHTWADDFLFAGGQERDLKRLAGWSSDVMLEKYGRSGADRRAAAAARNLRRGDRV
jgi:site-specific recombinase XerC